MSSSPSERITLQVDPGHTVSALLLRPANAHGCFVLAHGAGVGMEHPSVSLAAQDLAALGMATLRFQFPYMERGSRRPDAPSLCHNTVRAAVATATRLAPDLPLIAGGRSFGGRMTSQAQALEPLPQVHGLAFLAFPLHPAGKPSDERAQHLSNVSIPMLFLQGTRDELAALDLLEPVIARLGTRARLKLLQQADHSFHVPARSGRKDAEVRTEALQSIVDWARTLTAAK